MECVILFRNSNGRVGYIRDDESDEIAVFANFDEAEQATRAVTACLLYPWQIVELDEI